MLSLERQNQWREQYRRAYPDWQPATELFARLVRTHLEVDATLLDIGCGRGGLVEQLEHPVTQMLGVDPDWHSLTEHRLNMPRTVGLSDTLPFAAECFDVVFASWVLEHLERPLQTFQSIYRTLKPGGVFVFITPNAQHPLALLNNLLGRMGRLQGALVDKLYGRSHADTFPTYYRANHVHTLHELGQESGLRLKTICTIPDPSYLAFNATMFKITSWFEQKLPEHRRLHLVGVFQREDS
ncbi:MAG: class I SAM-dependent methyltransferase [Chloroflexi bacterium]|nr:MAG: class I SAM-dependent methyltransferase [Chloroflexota bacterium]